MTVFDNQYRGFQIAVRELHLSGPLNGTFRNIKTYRYLILRLLPSCLFFFLLYCIKSQFISPILTPWSRVLLENQTGFQLVKKFPTFYGTRRFITCIHNSPPPVPILIQLDPVHTPKSHFLKIHLNIILPTTPGSPKWSLNFGFFHQNPVYASLLPHTCYMPRPSHSRFYHPNNIQ